MSGKREIRLLAAVFTAVLFLNFSCVLAACGELPESTVLLDGWEEEEVSFWEEEALPMGDFFDVPGDSLSQEQVEYAPEEDFALWEEPERDEALPLEDEGEFSAISEDDFTDTEVFQGAEAAQDTEGFQSAEAVQDTEEFQATEDAFVGEGETVTASYVNENGKEMLPVSCTLLREGAGNHVLGDGWYLVSGEVRFSESMEISGRVNLILADGATLYADDGIWVKEDASFTIWAQSTGEKMGALIAKASSDYKAGIGGFSANNPGDIRIFGGKVTATGGTRGAGLGTGSLGTNVNIRIAGGIVTANGTGGGPGIGAGSLGINGKRMTGSVKITGGIVTAKGSITDVPEDTSSYGSAGIGAGFACNCAMTIEIEGGEVTAIAYGKGAGIGGGAMYKNGDGGEGGTVRITGGTVKVLSEHTAIGHGGENEVMGSLYIAPSLKVQAGNDGENYERIFSYGEREGACHYRKCALIDLCEHGDRSYQKDIRGHYWICSHCGLESAIEEHSYDESNVCRLCGYDGMNRPIQYVLADGVTELTHFDWKAVEKDMTSGWYVVSEDVSFADRMSVTGEVNLILGDDAILTAEEGITVPKGSKLIIWCQKGQSGSLIATGKHGAGIGTISSNMAFPVTSGDVEIHGGIIIAKGDQGSAGIGGGTYGSAGHITINGGNIFAEGYAHKEFGNSSGASGIGSGGAGGGGEITINGGLVTASVDNEGVGIGAASNKGDVNITINGGTITATGSGSGAGIGGYQSVQGKITINGGSVTATGGKDGAAGIGAGDEGNSQGLTVTISGGEVTATALSEGGAGIGGGQESWLGSGGEGCDVKILGGTVIVNSHHTAIGHGGEDKVMGSLFIGPNLKVQAGDDEEHYEGIVPTSQRVGFCQYRRCARIDACDHGERFYQKDVRGHYLTCAWCGYEWDINVIFGPDFTRK